MENHLNVRTIQLKLGRAFPQQIATGTPVKPKSCEPERPDATYLAFFVDAYQNPAAHGFHFA